MTYSRSRRYWTAVPGLEFSSLNPKSNMFSSHCLPRVGLLGPKKLLFILDRCSYKNKLCLPALSTHLMSSFLCLPCSSVFLIYDRSLCVAFGNEGFGDRSSKACLGTDPCFLNCRHTLHLSHDSHLSWEHRGRWNPELHFRTWHQALWHRDSVAKGRCHGLGPWVQRRQRRPVRPEWDVQRPDSRVCWPSESWQCFSEAEKCATHRCWHLYLLHHHFQRQGEC